MKQVAVIGGGASGMMAAIAAAKAGAQVTIFEKNDRIGKKILATGNGKCNYSNRKMDMDCYCGRHTERLPIFLAQFSVEDAVAFFYEIGMLSKEKNGYLYPLSEQAATVLDALRQELGRQKVMLRLEAAVQKIEKKKEVFLVEAGGKQAEYDSVILTCGGCAAPGTGSDGSGFTLAEKMGHHIIPLVPALVQLRCREDFFKTVAGVRCEAAIRLGSVSQPIQEEQGELQLTDYGISGIPVFQLSRTAAYLLKEKKEVCAYIDFFPQFGEKEYAKICQDRLDSLRSRSGNNLEEFLLGMANKKINLLMMKLTGLRPSQRAADIKKEKLYELLTAYRSLCVHITGTNPFENAQISAGGVDLTEITDEMESKKIPGLYFAGEILDVDGRCGGYNLQWAWTSGYIAGKNSGK